MLKTNEIEENLKSNHSKTCYVKKNQNKESRIPGGQNANKMTAEEYPSSIKRRNYQHRILHLVKISFKNKGKINIF